MRNVFCDVCGSAYPESESNCPICGSSREFSLDNIDDVFLSEGLEDSLNFDQRGAGRKKTREIFDYDEVNPEEEPEEEEAEFDDDEEYEEPRRSNVGLVVVLLILIVLLLATAGYMYLRFFLPNVSHEEETVPTVPTEAMVQETEPVVVETGIPCTDIVMVDGKFELGKGGKGMLNVRVFPEDTTDTLSYASSDEAVVTVSESGTLTAVGEGEATVTISCGTRQIKCVVLVDYSIEPEATEGGDLPGMTVEGESTEETAEDGQSAETEATEETEAAEETKAEEESEATEASTLKLKKNDITIFSNHTSVQLELEGDIDPEKVKWFTMDSTVAIVHGGLVTSTGSGITRIYGEYDGQQVECIVRCTF